MPGKAWRSWSYRPGASVQASPLRHVPHFLWQALCTALLLLAARESRRAAAGQAVLYACAADRNAVAAGRPVRWSVWKSRWVEERAVRGGRGVASGVRKGAKAGGSPLLRGALIACGERACASCWGVVVWGGGVCWPNVNDAPLSGVLLRTADRTRKANGPGQAKVDQAMVVTHHITLIGMRTKIPAGTLMSLYMHWRLFLPPRDVAHLVVPLAVLPCRNPPRNPPWQPCVCRASGRPMHHGHTNLPAPRCLHLHLHALSLPPSAPAPCPPLPPPPAPSCQLRRQAIAHGCRTDEVR